MILTVVVITAMLAYLKALMIPFVLSVFLFLMLNPGILWMQKKLKIPRGLAIFIMFCVGIIFSAALIMIIASSIRSLSNSAPIYESRISGLFVSFAHFLSRLGFSVRLDQLQDQLQPAQVLDFARKFTSQFLGIVGNLLLIFVFSLFLFAGSRAAKSTGVMQVISQKVSHYIWIKFIVSVIGGAVIGLFLLFMGIDLAVVIGVLTFLLNFIPNLGALIAILLPLPLAILQFGFGWKTWAILIILPIIHFVLGNVIEPRFMGKKLDLHPVAILFFLLFWGVVWGLPGMFLAVPLTAIFKSVMEQFPQTQFLAGLLAGRWSEQ